MNGLFLIDTPYIPDEKGCRLIWPHDDGGESVIYLRHEDLVRLKEILSHDSTGKIELEDGVSSILVNSDTTEFFMAGRNPINIQTNFLKEKLMEFLQKNPNA